MRWLLFTRAKSPLYPLDEWLGGSQNQCGPDGKEKNSFTASALNQTMVI